MEKQEQEQLKKIKNKLTELQKNGWEKYTYLSTEIEKHTFILETPRPRTPAPHTVKSTFLSVRFKFYLSLYTFSGLVTPIFCASFCGS